MRLAHWSTNAEQWLQQSPQADAQAAAYFQPATCDQLTLIAADHPTVSHPLRLHLAAPARDEWHSGIAHHHHGLLFVELEQWSSLSEQAESLFGLPLLMARANHRLQSCDTMKKLYAELARQVRSISGYDRVMVYRFLEDGHGEVVGESVDGRFESFLGLHYPASDVPTQARRLYMLNTVRCIGDVQSAAVPIVPEVRTDNGQPLDLSFCHFRAVSPIHIEYLQNMGVAASMSISIVQQAKLWGLIACHHYTSRTLSFEQRSACEVLGVMASSYLLTREEDASNKAISTRQKDYHRILRQVAQSDTFAAGIQQSAEGLCQLVQADGLAILLEGQLRCEGSCPAKHAVEAIIGQVDSEHVWSTNCLSEALDQPSPNDSRACGALAFHLDAAGQSSLVFFRDEYTHEVAWAGDPHKAATQTAEGMQLSPRRSFALWKETVEGRSRQWSDVDLDMAGELRLGLLELLGRRAAELARLNAELSSLNADLDSFAYAASHDLREPLRGLRQLIYFLRQELEEDPTKIEGRLQALERQVNRMADLIEGLLRLSRAGRGDLEYSRFTLEEVAREAFEMAAPEPDRSDVTFEVVDDATVVADFICMRELLINLLTNGLKYNDNATKLLRVGVVRPGAAGTPEAPQGSQIYYVTDNGIGIAAEQLDEVFQIFRRLHPPDRYGGGCGAGLAIVKKIVERHHGRVWIESTEGDGSTFYFTFSANSDV